MMKRVVIMAFLLCVHFVLVKCATPCFELQIFNIYSYIQKDKDNTNPNSESIMNNAEIAVSKGSTNYIFTK